MRPFVIELLEERVELGLLQQDVGARRTSGFFLKVRCMRSCRPFC